jgi:hypothetical protein
VHEFDDASVVKQIICWDTTCVFDNANRASLVLLVLIGLKFYLHLSALVFISCLHIVMEYTDVLYGRSVKILLV